MENAVPPLVDSLDRVLSDGDIDLDLMDELSSGGCWLDNPDYTELLQFGASNSSSPFFSSGFSPVFEISNNCSNPILPRIDYQDEGEVSGFSTNLLSEQIPVGLDGFGISKYSIQPNELDSINPGNEPGTSWWVRPKDPIISVEERLSHALSFIKDSQRYGDVLVQIWVPIMRGDRLVLTTYGQPFSLDSDCQSLVNYRAVSTGYQFSAEEDSKEALGLPGRVFLGRVPEWTPDVRYFSISEYPRVNHAHRYDVRSTIALPIFERDSPLCLGVVEVVTTAQKINYSSDLENICNALQAVNLRSSEVFSVVRMEVSNDSHQAALPEIREVLRAACHTHRLPLAQTWIPCIQQSKSCSRHSNENYKDCISTVDLACYVHNPSMLEFHKACSDHHLFRGQGVAGKAFTTNQPCFSSDVTAFSKIEYPLSHHAKLFHLQSAVGIRLRSIYTGIADFVLEFFLPIDCKESEEQKLILNSLSITIRQVCQSLRVVTDKEVEDEAILQFDKLKGASREGSSWVASTMEGQQKGASSVLPVIVPFKLNKQEAEGFTTSTWSEVVLPAGKVFTEFRQHHQDTAMDTTDHEDAFPIEPSVSNVGKATEKQRTKAEKTVSLQVLRQYFAGSLKDAATSIGVCPTTLKRICRHHGITRWPSRKIKKVGHSLKKLQVVIDSVQGAEGAFRFSSLYDNFTESSWPDEKLSGSSAFSSLKQTDHPESSTTHQEQEPRFVSHTNAPNCLSSSSCSRSSDSSLACSSDTNQGFHVPMEENQSDKKLKRAQSNIELHLPIEEAPQRVISRSLSPKLLDNRVPSRSLSPKHEKGDGVLKVKAIYGEEKVRFKLQPSWVFLDLKQEIGERFNMSDIAPMVLRYLDDDAEWVLLTCDADLQECVDVYRSSRVRTIKISVRIAQPVNRGFNDPTGLS